MVSFYFERTPGGPGYTFHLNADGSGSWATGQAGETETRLDVAPKTAARIFEQARGLRFFELNCASGRKGIASTGIKTLSYAGPDGTGSCSYDYSENKAVVALTDTFQAMAATLEEGRKLGHDHRYDRLALSEEMSRLVEMVQAGRAIELGDITPELTALADDTEVLEKVRDEAATLLKVARAGR